MVAPRRLLNIFLIHTKLCRKTQLISSLQKQRRKRSKAKIRKTKDILTAILTAEKKVLYLPVYKILKYGYYQILSHTSQI